MDGREYNVASLFAVLGLDTSQLDQGLARTRLNLEEFATGPISHITELFAILEKATGPVAFAKVINAMMPDAQNLNATLIELDATMTRLQEKQADGLRRSQKRGVIGFPARDVVTESIGKAEQDRAAAQVKSAEQVEALEAQQRAASRLAQRRIEAEEEAASEREMAQMRAYYSNLEVTSAREQGAALAAEMKAISAARKAQLEADKAQEKASKKELADMGTFYADQEKAAAKEEEAAWVVYKNFLDRRAKARADALKEEQRVYREHQELNRSSTANTTGSTSANPLGPSGTAVEFQALTKLFGFDIPRGLTNVLSKLPEVQELTAKAFNILVLVAFVEALGQVASKLAKISMELYGFTEANQRAWKQMEASADRALLKYDEYLITTARIEGQAKRQAMGSSEMLASQMQELDKFKALFEAQREGQKEALEGALTTLRDWNRRTRDETTGFMDFWNKLRDIPDFGPGFSKFATGTLTASSAVEKLNDNIERYKRNIEELSGKLASLEEQRKRDKAKAEGEDKGNRGTTPHRRGDPIHELPYRLPWFMGASAAGAFMSDLSGAGGRLAWESPYLSRDRGTSTRPLHMGVDVMGRMPPAMRIPQSHEMVPAGDSPGASYAPVRPGGGGGGISVVNTYAPVFKFDGVPADIQFFMRNHAEPMLAADLAINAKGVTRAFMDALKKHGMG